MAKKKLYQQLAFVWFLVAGTFVFIFGAVILGVGIVLTNSDEFNEPIDLKAQLRPSIDYVQYWVGIPYLFTGVAIILLAFLGRSRVVNICTMVFCLISVVLSLAGLVVDGPDFAWWNSQRQLESYWERQSGYSCSSKNGQCVCETTNLVDPGVTLHPYTDCENVGKIASLFGVLVGLIVATLIILLITIFYIVYVVTTNREKAYRGYGDYTTNGGGTELYAVNNTQEAQYRKPSLRSAYDTNGANQGYQDDYTVLRADSRNTKEYKRQYLYDEDGLPMQNATQLPKQNRFQEINTDPTKNKSMVLDPGHFKLGDDDIY